MGNNNRKLATPPKEKKEEVQNIDRNLGTRREIYNVNTLGQNYPSSSTTSNFYLTNNNKQELNGITRLPVLPPKPAPRTVIPSMNEIKHPLDNYYSQIKSGESSSSTYSSTQLPVLPPKPKPTPSIDEIKNSLKNRSTIKPGESSNSIYVNNIPQTKVLTMNSKIYVEEDNEIEKIIQSLGDCLINNKNQKLLDDRRVKTVFPEIPDSLTNDEEFQKQIENYFENISDIDEDVEEEEEDDESSSESGEVEIVKKKVSKLDSNVNDVYNKNELKNIAEVWHKNNFLDPGFWWKLVRLNDPVLITLKIVHCYQNRTKFEILLGISTWEVLIPMSIALKHASRCKLTYHKSRIVFDMLRTCNLNKIRSLITLHAQTSKDGIPIVRNLIEFYEDIIFYLDHSLYYADIRSLIEMLDQLKRFCSNNTAMTDSLRKLNFMIDKLKSGNFNSYSSCYPLNVLNSSFNVRIPKKSYSNIFHYIDTHLALLKEDFESSVRGGIEHRLTGKTPETEKSLTFYHNISISKSHKKAREFSYIIRFSPKDIKKFRTDNGTNNYFFYGSIIFLSSDEFKTYIFAKVEDGTHIKDDNGYVCISFPVVPKEIDLVAKYTMAEAAQYFDPYCSAMKILKNMPKHGLPFQRYIVNAERNILKPDYLKPDSIYKIFGHDVPVSDRNAYPLPEKLNLNSNQLDALYKALNNQLCLIQGPPGTGKTFMCRKIIQVLLDNKKHWTNKHNTPIVVVCYKNLSLDDLLTGLLKDNINVLRIGNRTSSEELSLFYSLSGMEPPKNAGTVTWSFSRLRFLTNLNRKEMDKCFNTMSAVQKKEGVVKLGCLKGLLKPDDVKYLKTRYLLWLFGLEKRNLKSFNSINGNANTIKKEHIRKFISYRKRLREKADKLNIERDLSDADLTDFEDVTNDLYTDEIKVANQILDKWKSFLNFDYEKVPEQKKQNILNMNLQYVDCLESRWILYYTWLELSKTFLNYKINDLTRIQGELKGRLQETFNLFDARKIVQSNIDVIGITTTSAARLNILLDEIKPRIVIFEEAAEIIEGFCVASISKHCEHMILLGDHKQLRPLTISHELSRDYNMGISLFERLANNGIEPIILNRQYRMRPEISALISPSIYNHLDNDVSVQKLGNVRGVAKSVFFFNHNNFETRATENKSVFNLFEAKFCIYLAHYLINQGYSPDEITIIAVYGEQEKVLISERQKMCNEIVIDQKVKTTRHYLSQVTIATADSYQGKENSIIILSLVRNNKQGDIGFLKTNNRVCVALSRAKIGLFIVGNMNILSSSSKLWKEVNDILVSRNDIGDSFVCVCQKHQKENQFESYGGLNSLKYGGCGAICKTKLECGHNCRYICHGWDVEHKLEFSCQLCPKVTKNFNENSQVLYSEPCVIEFSRSPRTENTHQDENNNCGFKYRCGHLCNFQCRMFGKGVHQPALMCTSKCGMILNCKHVCTLNCHGGKKLFHAGKFSCQVICDKLLPCGHKCTFTCHINKDVFHKSRFSCVLPCHKVLNCGHLCDYDCHSSSDSHHLNEYSCKRCKID